MEEDVAVQLELENVREIQGCMVTRWSLQIEIVEPPTREYLAGTHSDKIDNTGPIDSIGGQV